VTREQIRASAVPAVEGAFPMTRTRRSTAPCARLILVTVDPVQRPGFFLVFEAARRFPVTARASPRRRRRPRQPAPLSSTDSFLVTDRISICAALSGCRKTARTNLARRRLLTSGV
jgi:hypothetical protein